MWVVADAIKTSLPRVVRWHWHVHPNATGSLAQAKPPLSGVIQHRNGASLSMTTADSPSSPSFTNVSVVRGQLEPVPQGWYSPTYDVYGPSDAYQIDADVPAGTSITAWVFVAQPTAWDAAELPEASIVSTSASSVTVRVTDPSSGKSVSVVVPVQNRD
jgi:hypothetical protein